MEHKTFTSELQKVDPAKIEAIYTDGKVEIIAGPLLRYWNTDEDRWRGGVIYVTKDEGSNYDPFPRFMLQDTVLSPPTRYWAQDGISWWRFDLLVALHPKSSTYLTYELEGEHEPFSFWVPAQSETMRSLFHSCNGFSLGVDTSQFPGSMWQDVLRRHEKKPFHVMLGGGDQIYCDSIKTIVPHHLFQPLRRTPGQFSGQEADEKGAKLIELYYLSAYASWFGKGRWSGTNGSTHQPELPKALGSIPQLNIWDDHDIIDGFGSYNSLLQHDKWWKRIGAAAYKFYMLYQQGVGPVGDEKLETEFVSSGHGMYVDSPARSICARLGKGVIFYGLDCRMERSRHQICSKETYDAMFNRLTAEVTRSPEIEQLYVMLGVPIAYPRMVWAEVLMTSRIAVPLKWLARHKIVLKGFVNDFNGEVELLDDLDDHWCAKHHKQERNKFLRTLAGWAKDHSVRVTLLSGDVHLAAAGRFRTAGVEPQLDPWLMVCPVSSAITNTPPPSLLGDFMNKRNKLHKLPPAVEDMVPIFGVDVDGSHRNNTHTLTRRNYCILDPVTEDSDEPAYPGQDFAPKTDAQTVAAEAMPVLKGGVRVSLVVERDAKAKDKETCIYDIMVPPLRLKRPA